MIMSGLALGFTALVAGLLWYQLSNQNEVAVGGPMAPLDASASVPPGPPDAPDEGELGAPSALTAPPEPEFKPGEALPVVRARLEASHYLMLPGPRAVGGHEEAYAEGWEEGAWPRAYVLHFRTVAGRQSLLRVEKNPDAAARRRALGGDALQLSMRAESEAKAFAGPNSVRLDPAGPGGVALLGGRYRLDLRDANGNATTHGRLIGGDEAPKEVPLMGQLSQARHLVWALLSEDGQRLALMEQLPHSGLDHLRKLQLKAGSQRFEPLP